MNHMSQGVAAREGQLTCVEGSYRALMNRCTSLYLPVLLTSMAIVLWEILLTRIFSVVLFYHYAFMAVSIAMFGLTVGAVLELVRPGSVHETEQETRTRMGVLSLVMSLSMVLVTIIQLSLPLRFTGNSAPIWYLLATFLLSSLPFISAGSFISIAVTRFKNIGAVYASDLAGAAVGCALLSLALGSFGGPGAIIATAGLSSASAYLLLRRTEPSRGRVSLAFCVLLFAFAFLNTNTGWLRVRWWHRGVISEPIYEHWNAFSRIMVQPMPDMAFGWGIHPDRLRNLPPASSRFLLIDSGAGTPITQFHGDLRSVTHLKYDVTSIVHYIRPNSHQLIIGPGGGRDVLTALAFHQPRVDAVEVNPAIVDALNNHFGDYSGHLDRQPGVTFIVDEGRSYLARSREKYDIIQASLVDTVAATAAGAFAFTESGLYTTEAWESFLHHLQPRGVVTFSRWYYGITTWPAEVYRLVDLASTSLRRTGVADPERNIILVRTQPTAEKHESLATILVSPSAFSNEDILKVKQVCFDLKCDVVFSSAESLDPNLAQIIRNPEDSHVLSSFPLDISAPTDDRPFFFFQSGLKNAFQSVNSFGASRFNSIALQRLVFLMLISIIFAAGLIVSPMVWLETKGKWKQSQTRHLWMAPIFFASIGLGFMFVEIGLIQRLSIFLGHPTYGFTVVLFGLFVSTSIGSAASISIVRKLPSRNWITLAALPAVLVTVESVSPRLLGGFTGASTLSRIGVSLFVICPVGVFMGFPFPAAMEYIQRLKDRRGTWYWAINGAFSVIGSVLAMLVSITFGIHATILAGTAIYLVTAVVFYQLTNVPVGENTSMATTDAALSRACEGL